MKRTIERAGRSDSRTGTRETLRSFRVGLAAIAFACLGGVAVGACSDGGDDARAADGCDVVEAEVAPLLNASIADVDEADWTQRFADALEELENVPDAELSSAARATLADFDDYSAGQGGAFSTEHLSQVIHDACPGVNVAVVGGVS